MADISIIIPSWNAKQYLQKCIESIISRLAQIGFLVITGLHHIIRLLGESMLYIIKPEKRTITTFKIKRSIACIQWVAGFH